MPASYFQLFAPLFLPLLLLPGAAPFVLLQPSPLPSASPLHSTPAPKAEPFYEVNVAYNKSTLLAYAPATSTFMPLPTPSDQQLTIIQFTAASLSRTFLPEGVSVDYYSFIRWRISQRFVSAILYVLGTQSLLIGLGVKSRNNFAAGAALNWILKDALGKIARVFWAGKMGRKFDSDAKRWRFRGTLLYALGNGLEIATFIYPSYFLLFAAFGNCLKQVSMLTSSSTRNTIYNSFRKTGVQNIGDITARGEAQVSVVDLFGTAVGVIISKIIGLNVRRILTLWLCLQMTDSYFNYREIQSVVFKKLNFEKLWNIAESYVDSCSTYSIVPPTDVAKSERIFLPPKHLCRRAIAFGSLSRSPLDAQELDSLLDIFRGDKYLLVVGLDVKNSRRNRQRRKEKDIALRSLKSEADKPTKLLNFITRNAKEDCHIVLHRDATNLDIIKATLALACLRRELGGSCERDDELCEVLLDGARRTGDSLKLIKTAKAEADISYERFLSDLNKSGWESDKFMFGAVSKRNSWVIR